MSTSALGFRSNVHYLHQSYPRAEMAAMFLAADVMLVTPLRDGMNLVAKEYVACRHDLGGALVLSEFAGASGAAARVGRLQPAHDIAGLAAFDHVRITTPLRTAAPDASSEGGRRPRRNGWLSR